MIDLTDKISPQVVAAILAVERISKRLGFEYFLVGAAARDLLIQYAYDIDPRRATHDIDLGVRVRNWEEYELLAKDLVEREGCTLEPRVRHRFITPSSYPLDIVPFGPIAKPEDQILWPPEGNFRMSVEGFDQALASAIEVMIQKDPGVVVRVASIPGLALLKLLSWDDGYPSRDSDGIDFGLILSSYWEIPYNRDRLFTEVDAQGPGSMSPLSLGAQLLGRDVATIAGSGTVQHLIDIISREVQSDEQHLLVIAMRGMGGSTRDDEALDMLQRFELGLRSAASGLHQAEEPE